MKMKKMMDSTTAIITTTDNRVFLSFASKV